MKKYAMLIKEFYEEECRYWKSNDARYKMKPNIPYEIKFNKTERIILVNHHINTEAHFNKYDLSEFFTKELHPEHFL